ncbi:major facilitator superfamily protein [Streptococcus pseudoporcinus]|uniref:Major facilitator superfamily protein n=1 Tax=Streptococcus pseudoporcinus TaxID=361101 RepID=A0A4U9XH63_9STRE|nr:major facilitator superfamily protein [Streptococcus pseudoporcinus]VUC64937.1 major facilitator superfamily protein [Streptococcus pseudoporcinus]VUC95511.1 major facilitator superfamily protein [Streptococcus pseudoporcinus]VUC95906.1 major facilitator superfamily protein [Streptococcus pseudoporcinus]
MLIAMIINLGFSLFTLKNMSETHEMHLDLISVFLSTLAFAGFLYGFSRTSYAGFSDVTLWFVLVISTLALGAYIVRQRQLEEPMLNFDVLKERIFLQSCLIIMIMFVIFNASMTLMPFFIQKVSGMTAFQSGLLLLPGGLMMGILAPVTGSLFEKVGEGFWPLLVWR